MPKLDNDLISRKALLEAVDIKVKFETDEPINNAHKLINDAVVDEVKKAVEKYRQYIRNIITNAPTIEADSGEAVAWAVAECWSSSSPKRKVLCLADCPQKITYFESHHSFIRWVTSPQEKEFVSLTYDQKMDILENNDWYNSPQDLIDATEAKLKEVNHG